jgi:mRNA interferase MazF
LSNYNKCREPNSKILRVNIPQNTTELNENSDIMIDQIRAIDNKRLIKKIDVLPDDLISKVKKNLDTILNLSH